jgi:hypothetical protein
MTSIGSDEEILALVCYTREVTIHDCVECPYSH